MKAQRVLVTRPEPAASRTARILAERGFEPVLLPLTRTVPVELKEWPGENNFAAVAVTSANAVRHAPLAFLEGIADLPVFAVGERTGAVATAAGLEVVDAEAGDAARLVRRIAEALAPGARVLVLCGRVRRDTLEVGLAQAGLHAVMVETYDTIPLWRSEPEVAALLGKAPIDAVLLYSAFAAEVFGRIAGCKVFANTTYFAISERVAAVLPEAARDRSRVAREPTEEAILSLLSD